MPLDPARAFPIQYEPELVEEAVLAAMAGRPEEGDFRVQRDILHRIPDAEEREMRLRVLHTIWFDRLGLGEVIARSIRQQPSIPANTTRCLVGLAASPDGEGVHVFVAPGARPRRTVVFRVCPGTLAEPERFAALLQRELPHLADLLGPGAVDGPGPGSLAGPLPDPLVRERYRVLWDACIDGRLQRLGWAPPGIRADRLRDFAAAFPMLGEHAQEAFERFFGATALTHEDLLRFAAAPDKAGCMPRREAWS